jgi:curved DNA-binding protein CbpA
MDNSNPYQILGVDINDDIDVIKQRYRRLLLHFHPDKNKTIDIDESTRVEMLQSVKSAYTFLLNQLKIVDAPYEKISYEVEDDLKIQQRDDFIKRSSNEKINKKWNTTFNKIQKEIDKDDPNKIGYEEFNVNNKKITEIVENFEYDSKKLFDDNINNYNFKTPTRGKQTTDSLVPTSKHEEELGITTIKNKSIKIDENLEGTDLTFAFKNISTEHYYKEYENSMKDKDNNIINLLNDRLQNRMQVIEPLPEDHKLELKIKMDLERIKIQRKHDKKRQQILKCIIDKT